jgi:glycosyltransferase involved in cell wall biosynthesis
LRVLFLPLYNYNWASSRCRVYLYKKKLEENSIKVNILSPPNPNPCSRGFYVFRVFFLLLWADLVYIQKKIFPPFLFFIIRVFNNKIIFDFDDAIFACPTSADPHPFDVKCSEKKLGNILKKCRYIVTGNSYLSQFAKKYNSHITIIPTPVDHELFSPLPPEASDSLLERKEGKVVLGWVGKKENLIYLDIVKEALQEISDIRQNLIILKIVCDQHYFIKGVDVLNQPWDIKKEVDNLRSIDIGLMPLIDDEWSRGKCSFKALQFMSLGIPVVISPVGTNNEIVSHGENGYFADTKEEWIKYLLDLIDDEKTRKIIGMAGRKYIITKYTYEVATPMLLKVLKDVFCD